MRVFKSLSTAADEIQRDVYKAGKMDVSRVQQWDNLMLVAREAFGYSYTILPGGIPEKVNELVDIGIMMEFPPYMIEGGNRIMTEWLLLERAYRVNPEYYPQYCGPSELKHPALEKTLEGSHPSYTYRERLTGMIPAIVEILKTSPDTRRAYWPIFRPEDTLRAMSPTRVPCSLGYQFAIRQMQDGSNSLLMLYSQRSSDFDNFWLSDVWLANQIQITIADILGLAPGPFIHMIHSFHSFEVGNQEIY